MAKHFFQGKRRGAIVALSAALCATLSLGMLAACGEAADTPDEDEDEATSTATDNQLLRNGNFEFFGERDTKLEDKRSFISSPTSWSFTSGSPSSWTSSGIVKADEWKEQLSKSTYSLVPEGAAAEIGDGNSSFTAKELTDEIASNAEAHWDEASVYDRLLFYKYYGVDSSSEFSLYSDYAYSIDFEDVQYLGGDIAELTLHDGVDEDENAVLMIHNKRVGQSDHVLGTAQYYTSSTTITLEAGTAAEVSVWVRTDKLYHWYAEGYTSGDKTEVQEKAGAYIGVINTVGGTTLPEMQVKNIRTDGKWEQYSFYIRANTYATTTFRLKLGLGQGTSSDNRYENVDGYAFFDDVVVKKISAAKYADDVKGLEAFTCDINSASKDKIFDFDAAKTQKKFALDLLSDNFDALKADEIGGDNFTVGLTETESGSVTEQSFIGDNRNDGTTPANEQSIVGMMNYGSLREMTASNGYLKNVFEKDFLNKFPFAVNDSKDSVPVLMLLSTNGAAYTATVKNDELFKLAPNSRMLVSFFVKTWDVLSGRSGAGITLVDGEEETSITPFDSKTVSPVTIDEDDPDLTDIYKGWVQCFFFVSNDTDTDKTFHLKFTYGVTNVSGTDASSYGDGYAAFTDFKVMSLTKTQYSYASTGTYAQKVSLTAYAENTSKFDSAEASSNIEEELAAPSSFRGVVAGSNIFEQGGTDNLIPDGVYAGLLRKEYAKNYRTGTEDWATALGNIAGTAADADAWWNKIFGEADSPREANQPLVLINTSSSATPSYGFISRTTETTISASSSQRITVRVKVAADTTANIYLVDTSEDGRKDGLNTMIAPSVPKNTYWYDDDGNILRRDPESDDFDKKTDVLFYLEANGLYSSRDTSDTKLYANLANYTKDEDENLLTADDVIAFYYNKVDKKYYGYFDEASGEYSQPVEPLPTTVKKGDTDVSILRYTGPESNDKYKTVISVTGTAANQNRWIDVNFYVRTGSKAKTYRLELWAGARDNATDGFPAGGYVFFDAYSAGSITNFEDLRDGETGAKGLLLEKAGNQLSSDPEKLNENLALYYTFSFYDSASYLRHDREHEGVDYNKWENYKQSSYEEGIVWLECFDADGSLYGKAPSYSLFLDFTPLEVSVTAYTPEETADSGDDDEEETTPSDTNIWLVLSSSLLAFVTLFAVGAVIFRTVRKNHRGGTPVKKPKAKKARPAPAAPVSEETPEETPAPEAKDERDPYND